MKPVNAIKEIRDELIADAKAKADAMAKAAVRAEAETMYKLAKNGMKREEIAALFECGVATVHRRIRLHTEENNIARGAGGKLIKGKKHECNGDDADLRHEEKHEVAELQDEHREEILLALPAPLYKAPDKAVIAEGWKEGKTPEQVVVKRKWVARDKYRDWCKAHKDQHEAINYFRLLNKRGGRINLKEKIGTLKQMKLIREFPKEEMNIKKYAPKFNIRFRNK